MSVNNEMLEKKMYKSKHYSQQSGCKISSTNAKRTDIDVNIMRIIAAFFVAMIHVVGNSNSYLLTLNCISRFSVPIFIMVSGRYMLAKKHDNLSLIKKCGRLLFLMIIWSAIFYVYNSIRGQEPVIPFLSYLVAGPVHFWYIWAIIILYLMTPILFVFCENSEQKIYRYALVFTFIAGTFVTLLVRAGSIAVFSNIIERSKLPYQLGFVFCFLFGDYYRRYQPNISKSFGAILFVGGTICTIISGFVITEDLALSFFSPSAIIAAVGLYCTLSQLEYTDSAQTRNMVSNVANCTLGIYLMHPLLIDPIESAIKIFMNSSSFYFYPLCTVIVFAFSFVLTFIIKHIPIIKSIV